MIVADIVRPLVLTARLLARFWPQLLLIAAVGMILRDLLLNAAVGVGLNYPLGGMVTLSLVVLVKLLVVVAMFAALRPGLPALASLREEARMPETDMRWRDRSDRVLAATTVALLPFFAYYAAWGFLGDTVREYSRLALARVPFGESLNIFAFMRSGGLIAAIVFCWFVRWGAKRMHGRSHSPYWRLLVVAADATWIFIGLYALGVWKDDFIEWLGAGALVENLAMGVQRLSMAAHAAAGFKPVEFREPGIGEQAQRLFFYALLPMVWLVMAAIINGYDLSAAPEAAAAPSGRSSTWRGWLNDFLSHFIGGYRSRYQPVWTCLKLTLGAGLGTLLTFIVAYRMLNWLGAWLWYLATRTLEIHDLAVWQVAASVIGVFIGSPSDLDGGILLDAARIALLAAVLETPWRRLMSAQRSPRLPENELHRPRTCDRHLECQIFSRIRHDEGFRHRKRGGDGVEAERNATLPVGSLGMRAAHDRFGRKARLPAPPLRVGERGQARSLRQFFGIVDYGFELGQNHGFAGYPAGKPIEPGHAPRGSGIVLFRAALDRDGVMCVGGAPFDEGFPAMDEYRGWQHHCQRREAEPEAASFAGCLFLPAHLASSVQGTPPCGPRPILISGRMRSGLGTASAMSMRNSCSSGISAERDIRSVPPEIWLSGISNAIKTGRGRPGSSVCDDSMPGMLEKRSLSA